MYTFIYALCDPSTMDIRYVGKSNNPKSRFNCHIKESLDGKHSHKCCWIRTILQKGEKPHLWILDEVDIKDWEFWECFYIDLFKSYGFNLTNIDKGGRGSSRISDETRRKLSISKIGRKLSHKTRSKMSNSQRGKKKPDGFGERSSIRQKGKKLFKEHIEKISKSLKGKYTRENSKISSEFEIYDSSGKIVHKFKGDFLKQCEERNLPGRTLKRSYLKGGEPIFSSKQGRSKAGKNSILQGWYAIKK